MATKKAIEQSVGITGAAAQGLLAGARAGLFDPEEETLDEKVDRAGQELGRPEQYDETLPIESRFQAAGQSLLQPSAMTDPEYQRYLRNKRALDLRQSMMLNPTSFVDFSFLGDG